MSAGSSKMEARVKTTLQIAEQRLPTDDTRGRKVWRRIVQPLLGIGTLEAVPLDVFEKLRFGIQRGATDDAHVAQLDLAVLLEFVLS